MVMSVIGCSEGQRGVQAQNTTQTYTYDGGEKAGKNLFGIDSSQRQFMMMFDVFYRDVYLRLIVGLCAGISLAQHRKLIPWWVPSQRPGVDGVD